MPVVGASKVKLNAKKLIDDIAEKRTRKVLTAVLSTGAAYAKTWTPVDTATLINSQRQEVRESASGLTGRVWYDAGFSESGFNYAMWLETNDNWKPRKKKQAGPHFLQRGFEDPAAVGDINNVIINGYKL